MKLATVAGNTIILHPETVKESGLMQWLSNHCENKKVTLRFDTHAIIHCDHHPALWLEIWKEG